MRRLFSAILSAMLIAGLLPLHAMAAAAVADDQSVTVTEDVATPITLAASGGDGELTFSVVDQPLYGSLTGTAPDVTYTPDPNYNGPDSFTFMANDTVTDSNTATVAITVAPVNDPPVANDDPAFACGAGAFGGSFPIPEDDAFGPQPPNSDCSLGKNDTDVDGDALTAYELVTQAAHGTAAVGTDGSWSYTPNADFFTPALDYLSDSFTYRAFDGTDWSAPATMRLWIAPVNDAPSFTPGIDVTVDEDSGAYNAAWATSVSAGPGETDQTVDFVIDLATNSSLFATGPAISPTGALTFVPAANRYGSSTVTVHAHDNGGLEDYGVPSVTPANRSATQTFTITVAPVNDAPTPADASATFNEDAGPSLIRVSAVDVEGNNATAFAVATQPAHGSVDETTGVTCGPPGTCSGAFIYTPDPNYNGPDSFTFAASDGLLDSATATVSITVTPVNDAPVCSLLALGTDKNVPVDGTVTCTDVDSPTLTLRIGTAPGQGAVVPFDPATGAFTYTPNSGVIGADSFTVIANDGTVDSAPVTVDIAIGNHAPVCVDAAPAAGNEDTNQTGMLSCSDSDLDSLTYAKASGPSNGSVSVDPGTGAWTYTPVLNYNGPDSFTFTVNDGTVDSAPRTVLLTIADVNDAPVCTGPYASSGAEDTQQGGTLVCTDVDSASLTYAKTGDPAHGTIAVTAATGAFKYTPAADDNGPDSFTFAASDGLLDSATATVSITVTPVNDAPAATAQSVTTAEDTATAITLAGTDADGDPLNYAVVTSPTHGVISGIAPALTYTPVLNYNGTDSFTFTASDGHGDSAPQTVSLTIADVNDAPVARTDGYTVNATSAGVFGVLANDFSGPAIGSATSEPTDVIAVTSVTQGAMVVTSIAPGGTAVVYDVKGCAYGGDSFTYTVTDSHGLSRTATVFVTIARPGTNGLSSNPITDQPTLSLVTNSTIGSTVPARLSWCGVTRSGYSVRSYTVRQSTNGGTSYASKAILSGTKATSSTRNLSVGTTYRWRAKTTDSAGRVGGNRYSPTARIARYQETSSGITYAPAWGVSTNSSASGGAERATAAAGASASITLTNVRQVAIVGPRSATRGSFEVWVDGAKVATVSERASTTVYRRVLYVRSLTPGTHTIKIVAAGNGRIDLDAILALS